LVLPIALILSPVSMAETVQDIAQTLNQPGSTGAMNSNISTFLGIALLLGLPLLVIVWLYNGLVDKEENTLKSWAQVEAAYQRRADLIPALVEAVARYVKHEQATFAQVAEERAQTATVSPAELDRLVQAQKQASEMLLSHRGKTPTDDGLLAELANAQAIVGKSARGLIAMAESYPQLRASDQFLELQAQFEGTENRILTARNRFDEAVENYNGAIRKLPGSLLASIGNFQRKAYFRADAASARTPERQWE
jgi:LemA protein